jgi:hypothetical protein
LLFKDAGRGGWETDRRGIMSRLMRRKRGTRKIDMQYYNGSYGDDSSLTSRTLYKSCAHYFVVNKKSQKYTASRNDHFHFQMIVMLKWLI